MGFGSECFAPGIAVVSDLIDELFGTFCSEAHQLTREQRPLTLVEVPGEMSQFRYLQDVELHDGLNGHERDTLCAPEVFVGPPDGVEFREKGQSRHGGLPGLDDGDVLVDVCLVKESHQLETSFTAEELFAGQGVVGIAGSLEIADSLFFQSDEAMELFPG